MRPHEEYQAGHIPGAINIPIAELADRLAELAGDRDIVAYCRGAYCVMAPMPSASRATRAGGETPRRRNARMAIGRTAGRRGCTGRAWGLIARGAEGSLRLVKRQPELLVAQHEHWQDTYRAHPVLYGTRPSEPGYMPPRCSMPTACSRCWSWRPVMGVTPCISLARASRWWPPISATLPSRNFAEVPKRAGSPRRCNRLCTICASLCPSKPVPLTAPLHMALCMALSTSEIHAVVAEVGRVLRPGGKFIYTVRHTGDAHYGAGQAHGDDIFECAGFAVHFFRRELVARLATGWVLEEVHDFEEGELPGGYGGSLSPSPPSRRCGISRRCAPCLGTVVMLRTSRSRLWTGRRR